MESPHDLRKRSNIDAVAVRVLNPKVRLVVRAKENLNKLLDQRLGNFVAAETQLTAPAFAIAALDSEIQGFIDLGDRLLRVVKYPITEHHRWCVDAERLAARHRRLLHELNSQTRRILNHIPDATELPPFYHWKPDTRIRAGDTVVYIEELQGLPDYLPLEANSSRKKTKQNFGQFWQGISDHLFSSSLQQILINFYFKRFQGRIIKLAP